MHCPKFDYGNYNYWDHLNSDSSSSPNDNVSISNISYDPNSIFCQNPNIDNNLYPNLAKLNPTKTKNHHNETYTNIHSINNIETYSTRDVIFHSARKSKAMAAKIGKLSCKNEFSYSEKHDGPSRFSTEIGPEFSGSGGSLLLKDLAVPIPDRFPPMNPDNSLLKNALGYFKNPKKSPESYVTNNGANP
jgi:hypothetical protein